MKPTPQPPFSAVLLCGGQSTRMGFDKAFLTYRSTPLWKLQLTFLRSFGPQQIMISGRSGVSYPDNAEVVSDTHANSGPVAGIAAALANCLHPHLLVLAVDMPNVCPDLVRDLLALRQPGYGVIPFMGDDPEPLLALYPKEAFSIATKQLLDRKLKARAFAFACEQAGILHRFPCSETRLASFENWNSPADRKT